MSDHQIFPSPEFKSSLDGLELKSHVSGIVKSPTSG